MEVEYGAPQQHDPFAEVLGTAQRPAGTMVDEVTCKQFIENGEAAVVPLLDQPRKTRLCSVVDTDPLSAPS